MHGGRVLVCTSDGCLSTSADGENGWSDMSEIAHLDGTLSVHTHLALFIGLLYLPFVCLLLDGL